MRPVKMYTSETEHNQGKLWFDLQLNVGNETPTQYFSWFSNLFLPLLNGG